MKENFHYDTVMDAIDDLKRQGFAIDFNVEGDRLINRGGKSASDDFEIVDVYRYEGDSDPGDEAVVYAIESKSGLKGILVTGYGYSSDEATTEILKKLHTRAK